MHIKYYQLFLMILVISVRSLSGYAKVSSHEKFFPASDQKIKYCGRINFKNPALPRFWSPGVYFVMRFKGNHCSFIVNDENSGGKSHNYIEVELDGELYRIKLKNKTDTIEVSKTLKSGEHTLLICKSTESSIGYMEFVGIRCQKLLSPRPQPKHLIEYIGDSITAGASNDKSEFPCDSGQWHDHNNTYLSYGPTAARKLNSAWQVSAVSGIGLIHSCCNRSTVMPQIYNSIRMRANDTLTWNFEVRQPDVVTICLGQNDGPQDSTAFCNGYLSFIKQLRTYYPKADIICMNSPMGDKQLTLMLKNYLGAIEARSKKDGDSKVHAFFLSTGHYHGCSGHPDIKDHAIIASELSSYIKTLKNW